MKILVVEDDARTAEFLLHGLRQSGYTCEHSADGMDGLFKAENAGCDLLIVDVMLPKLDGLTMISRMREHGVKLPVIVLSARDAVDDRIRGLQAGGDDYMTKPFSFSELAARITALMRRVTGAAESSKLTVPTGDDIKNTVYIWLTDDDNRLPVYISVPISVGKLEIRTTSLENVKYPLTSKVK